MTNLNEYKRERENKNYFRVVRDNLSLKKRTATYLGVGALAGGVGALVMLIPAIGPIIAAPTYFTVLSVSANLVGAAAFGAAPVLVQHYAIMRRDNKLMNAERSIQSAARIQLKLNDKENMSDKKFAKLSAKRDKKLNNFDKVYRMYERKTKKLASKMDATYDVVNDSLVEGSEKKGTFLYERRMKRLKKVSRVYRDLHEDKVDFYNIKYGDAAEDFRQNFAERRASHRAKVGATAVAGATKSGAIKAGKATKKGVVAMGHGAYAVGAGAVWGAGAVAGATKSGVNRFRAFVDNRRNGNATQEENENINTSHNITGSVKNGFNKIYGATKGVAKTFSEKVKSYFNDGYLEGAKTIYTMPIYQRADRDDLSLYEQFMLIKETYPNYKQETNLIRYNTKTNAYDLVQPKFYKKSLVSKGTYLNDLQNQSIYAGPLSMLDGVTMDDYVNYYSNTVYEDKMNAISEDIKNMDERFKTIEKTIDEGSIKTQSPECDIFIQLDLDSPKCTISRKFDDVQKALAYTRFVQRIGSSNFEKGNCDCFRVTTWQKVLNGIYKPVYSLSNVVDEMEDVKDCNQEMRNAFLREMRTLHKNDYVKNQTVTPLSTLELIQKVENLSGNGNYTEQELKRIYSEMTSVDLNSLIGEERLEDEKTFSQREKEFYQRQFSRSVGRESNYIV